MTIHKTFLVGLACAAVGILGILAVGCADQASPGAGDASGSRTPASPSASASSGMAAGGHMAGHGSPSGESNPVGGSHAMGMSGIEALQKLKGKEFDVAFLSQMIAHHQAAIQMANDALKSATKPETKAEAQKVIDAQTKEVSQMTGWLKTWYNTAPDPAQQALVKADMAGMMAMPVSSDAMFFEMMIPHHQGAIDMSKLVPERSEKSEVKKLAQDIIAAQEREIKEYQQHLGQK